MPSKGIRQTPIYNRSDAVVDRQSCRTGKGGYDFQASAAHLGLVFSPIAYELIAKRLAGRRERGK